MDLGDILGPEQIIPDLQASNRWEAIDELINNLVATNKIKAEHRETVSAVVMKRESSMSTGIGFCIGITIASRALIYEVAGALGQSRPISMRAGQSTRQLVAVPRAPGQFQKHLHTPGEHRQTPAQSRFRGPRTSAQCRGHAPDHHDQGVTRLIALDR
jgi:PTS system fructose-specific IIA component/PTS system nitrogen regulatory IIA component